MERRLNITYEGLRQSYLLWSSDSSLRSELRFGQYIWNKFGIKDQSWPFLFYLTDNGEAYNLAYQQCGLADTSE